MWPDSFGGDALEVGIGVTKENAELTAMINQAILDIAADGTYSEIYVKWFGIGHESELPRANCGPHTSTVTSSLCGR